MVWCHRRDQEIVCTFLTHNSYELHIFKCASRKYGLEESILGHIGCNGGSSNDDKKVLELLRHGIYNCVRLPETSER